MRNQLAPMPGWETGELMGNCRQNASGSSMGLSHLGSGQIWWVSSCGVTAARVSLLLLLVGAAGHRESREGQIRGSVLSPGLTSAFCILWLKTPAISLSRWSRTWDTGLSEPLLPAKLHPSVVSILQSCRPSSVFSPCGLSARCSAVKSGCFPFTFGGKWLL